MLQGKVEIGNTGGEYGFDKAIAQRRRVEVEQAHALDALCRCGDELDDVWRGAVGARPGGSVVSIGGEILRHEHDLSHLERLDLGQDRGHWSRALPATKRGDGAEAAPTIAPFGDLDVGPRRARLWSGKLQQVEAAGSAVDGRGLRSGPHDAPGGPHLDRHAEPGHEVYLAKGSGELLARALCEAACHNESGALLAHSVELEDCLDRLLSRGLDECARVHDDK